MEVRNVISTCLLAIGVIMILIGIIAGLSVATDEYGDFNFVLALYWWLSGIISGFLFIGLSEIVNLLQQLLDKDRSTSRQMEQRVEKIAVPVSVAETSSETTSSDIDEESDSEDNSLTKINSLTIRLNNERIKGAIWIDRSSLQIVQKGMFQSNEDARIVKTIPKNSFTKNYRKEGDFLILNYQEGQELQTVSFKTFNVHDYQRIVNLLKLQQRKQ